MLSYQHEFHAGNHADVLKHTCLLSILNSLSQKEKPFTVIDSHGGAGTYRLDDERLCKTGEHLTGIYRLLEKSKNLSMPPAVERYIQFEKPYVERGLYAGSPTLTRHFLRSGDSHFVVELHPQAFDSLTCACQEPLLLAEKSERAKAKTHIHKEDSYRELLALTPPLVKRGLILVDPSYEDASDYEQVSKTLDAVHKKWNTAIIAVWYPLLQRRKNETAQMLHSLETTAKTGTQPVDCMRTELAVKQAQTTLYGSGMFVINPPWKYEEEINAALDFLKPALSQEN